MRPAARCGFGAKLRRPVTLADYATPMNASPKSINHPALLRAVAAVLLLGVLGMAPAPARADNDKLNGGWVLDEQQSETYKDAAKKVSEQIQKLHKKHRKQGFDGQEHSGGGGNKYYEQQRATQDRIREDSVNIDWSLFDDLNTVMAAKTIKIYQSRMCAVLYDKRIKRLFSINPEGNSYSISGTEIAHDVIGRTVSYFEGQTLVIDTDIKGGDRLMEKFALGASDDELKIVAKYRRTDLRRTVEYTRVYHRGE